MQRSIIILFIALIAVLSVSAQSENDSILSQQLDEVVVKAYNRIQRGDTLCVIPTPNQKKFSFTGYDILRSMMLPGLRVNTVSGDLSLSDGSSVVVLIDGRLVEKQDILALRSNEIARVEYIQTPSPEYGYNQSIGAVINIVKKIRTDGYAAAVVTNNAVTTANGENFAFGKYTKNNSEYAISINSSYASLTERRIDNTNVYMFGDQEHVVNYKGLDTPLKYTHNTLQAGYNYYIPNKQLFDITFKGMVYYSPDRAHAQEVNEDGKSPYFQLTEPYEKYISPSLNIYYKHYFTKNSILTANLVGQYRNTDYHYTVTEATSEDFIVPTNIYEYGTKSHRQSYIGEVVYLNKLNRKFNFSVASRVAYAYTENDYIGDNISSDKQHNTNVYTNTYAYGYLGKLYYLAGVGFSGRFTKQNDESLNKCLISPLFRLVYNLKGWRFNLSGSLRQQSPTLSEKASAEFQINQYEIKRGNPNLEDWWRYRFNLIITKRFGPLNLQNTLNYTYDHNPVMADVTREQTSDGDLFITSFKNQRRMSVLTNRLNIDCGLSNNFMLSIGLNFNSYQSRGLTYSHNLSNWQFDIAADWYAGNWNVGFNCKSREKSLSGETISYVGATNTLYVNYVIGNQWRFGILGQYLFCKNGVVNKENLDNQYMIKNEKLVVPAHKNMIMITAAWNFSVGKQRKEAKIDLNNEDNSSGVFK